MIRYDISDIEVRYMSEFRYDISEVRYAMSKFDISEIRYAMSKFDVSEFRYAMSKFDISEIRNDMSKFDIYRSKFRYMIIKTHFLTHYLGG